MDSVLTIQKPQRLGKSLDTNRAILRSTKGMEVKFIALACLVAATLAGCGGGGSDAPEVITSYGVSYTINSPDVSSASVTLRNGVGGTEQRTVMLPASLGPYIMHPGDFLYISAQKPGASGTITASIVIGGKIFKTASSNAPYGIASASGNCC